MFNFLKTPVSQATHTQPRRWLLLMSSCACLYIAALTTFATVMLRPRRLRGDEYEGAPTMSGRSLIGDTTWGAGRGGARAEGARRGGREGESTDIFRVASTASPTEASKWD